MLGLSLAMTSIAALGKGVLVGAILINGSPLMVNGSQIVVTING